MREFFKVNVSEYDATKDFDIVRPSSLDNPRDNAVMFISEKYMNKADAFAKCSNCLVFWPDNIDVPAEIDERHAVVRCENVRRSFGRFFRDNNIIYYPQPEEVENVNGALIAKTAIIGKNCCIMPGVYIGGEVKMGDNCYIGAGSRLVGEVIIGNNVIIRENSVIGADGLSTDRDDDGTGLTIPQFGGVIIEDDVQIGALTVIARAAIDYTVLKRRSKIDNSAFISHNVTVGEDTFVVGESIMFGSSSVGSQTLISGNSAVRDGRHIGNNVIVGMGSIVVNDIEDGTVVKGNPAKQSEKKI